MATAEEAQILLSSVKFIANFSHNALLLMQAAILHTFHINTVDVSSTCMSDRKRFTVKLHKSSKHKAKCNKAIRLVKF